MRHLLASVLCFLLWPTAHISALAPSPGLQVVKQWKLLGYNFPQSSRSNDANFYSPTNVLITGIAVSEDRIFVATPKLLSGVSSTVSWVPKAQIGDSPTLQAYPDWSFSNTARTNFNCSDLILTSVYRLRIDSCNRLWILDAGISRSLEDYETTCPPKILVVDLDTDRVVRRIDFPREVLRGESLFTNMVIDETTAKSCDDVFVYITDTVEPGIIVYDSAKDLTWRHSHPAMYPDPDFAQSEILNDRFVLMDGVVGLAFDERNGIVYFQPLATDRVFSVHKNVLRSGPLANGQMLDVKLVGKKSSQGIGLAVSPYDSSLIFSPLSETAIASWNPSTNQQSVLAQDRDNLQFVADITRTRSEPGVIYAIASKFHRFFLKNLNPNEYNNRIVRLELPTGKSPGIKTPLLGHQLAVTPKGAAQNSLLPYGVYTPHTQTHTHTNALQTYFTSPALTTRTPYKFENAGVVNYGLRNPFTALNQGEAFPPTKATRDIYQRSYLDTLVADHVTTAPASAVPYSASPAPYSTSPVPYSTSPAAYSASPATYTTRHNGYYYHLN
ncbi:GH18542 [Drosophila grimshawi]|uniref:GH18542 n=2 Tax=Drosophila grimshawi TaxID=7222 RepID=B4JI77_DROGR|nr:GH18542 [Drosophila grimshawi]